MYEDYLKRKSKNEDKVFIFKSGNFYIFLGKDAKVMSDELGLKLTKFSNATDKCGFPLNQLDKYTKFIKLLNYEYEIVLKPVDQVIEDIKNIDIDKLDASIAIDKIKEYKRLLKNE